MPTSSRPPAAGRRRGLPGPAQRVALVLAAGTALAACGGGSAVHSNSSTTTTSTPTPTPTSTPSTSTVTTTPAGLPRCSTAQLQVSFGMLGAGAGNRYVRLILTNTGSPCQTRGYVGMQLLGPGGQHVPTNVVRDLSVPAPTVTVAVGAKTSALLHWGAIPGANEPQSGACEPVPQQVEVTPPNDFQFAVAPWTFDSVCEQGRINTGPMQPGVPAP